MTMITRRQAMSALASISTVAGAGSALALPAAAAVEAPQMTARERYDFHLEELKKAATEIDPSVRFTQSIEELGKPDNGALAVLIMGQWAKGRYDGDGVYAGGSEYAKRDRFNVTIIDAQTDGGERRFSVIGVGESDRRKWMTMSENNLEAFIGEKVAAA